VKELLGSRFVYATIDVLLCRPELFDTVLPWWETHKNGWKKQDFPVYRQLALLVVAGAGRAHLTDERLAIVADAWPEQVLRHNNCGDAALRAVAKAWVDYRSIEIYSDINAVITLLQIKRMAEVSDVVPPPLQDRSDELGYYSAHEEKRRELMEELQQL